ncbi:hypothetical protein ACP275_06G049900 [Erythranthe tilingii]
MSDVASNCYKNLLQDYQVCLPIRNQKGGDCWANAASALLSFEVQKISVRPDRKSIQVSTQHLLDHTHEVAWVDFYYWNYSPCKHAREAYYVDADGYTPLNYARLRGVCFREAYHPYTGRFTRNAKIPLRTPKIWVKDVVKVSTFDEVKTAIDSGHPVLGYIDIYPGLKSFDGKRIYSYKKKRNEVLVGHKKFYVVQNSWGESWGRKGIGEIDCNNVRPQCHASEVCVQENLPTHETWTR